MFMKITERYVLIFIVIFFARWISVVISYVAAKQLLVMHMSEAEIIFIGERIGLAVSILSRVVCALWLWVEAVKERERKLLWLLAGACIEIYGVLLFFAYIIRRNQKGD